MLQAIDANQDGYLEESLKLCAALHEFDEVEPGATSGPAIVGFTENIFSGLGTLGAFAATSERVFGTLVQRTMAAPLRCRYHCERCGHPRSSLTHTHTLQAHLQRLLHLRAQPLIVIGASRVHRRSPRHARQVRTHWPGRHLEGHQGAQPQ